jgi:hypothetical protein
MVTEDGLHETDYSYGRTEYARQVMDKSIYTEWEIRPAFLRSLLDIADISHRSAIICHDSLR